MHPGQLTKNLTRLADTIAVLIVVGIVLMIVARPILGHFTVPGPDFSKVTEPPPPDYSLATGWAALPGVEDTAAAVDVFYMYPTSYLLGRNWNAGTDNVLANYITDHGVLNQQASVFAGTARIYVPRYRQASQGAQMQSDRPAQKQQALALAYSDLQRAFDYYLQHYNQGRPFFIAAHSQGTAHGIKLVPYLFQRHPQAAKDLIAAYLVGNTVSESGMSRVLPVCTDALASGCFLSWNSVLKGGDASHWLAKGDPVCVNPLSWRRDELPVPASENLGSIKLTQGLLNEAPQAGVTGAQCMAGVLWIDPPKQEGYDLALFPGGSYHAYDYNLFYLNISANIRQRTRAFLRRE